MSRPKITDNDRETISVSLDDEELPSAEEISRMYALYRGEKAAGLLDGREEYEAKLRDAGRGHLIGN